LRLIGRRRRRRGLWRGLGMLWCISRLGVLVVIGDIFLCFSPLEKDLGLKRVFKPLSFDRGQLILFGALDAWF
jgi:hypothetical protein